MNNRAGIAILGIIIVVILGLTLYWQFGPSQKASVIDSQQTTPVQTNDDVMIITAMHQYTNGKHVIAGQADVPTPCHALSQNVSITEAVPTRVNVAFTTTTGSDVCAQVITSARFKVEFMAEENAVISATWNGSPVQFNLIPAGPNDDLDSFDVFIKG